MTVEDPGAAGLGGSDVSDESLRLASGLYIGERTGAHQDLPWQPPPPPPPRMRLGNRADGQVMSARPRAAHSEFDPKTPLMHPAVRWGMAFTVFIVLGLMVALMGELHP